MKTYENELKIAVGRIASVAFGRAREICPVRTGRLKNSITLTKTENGAVISTNVHYAAKVEFGGRRNTPRHYMGGGAAYAAEQAIPILLTELFGERSGNA